MTVFINTPVKPHHRQMLEQAAEGRCQLVYADDGADCLETAEVVMGYLDPADVAKGKNLRWYHLVWAGVDPYCPHHFPTGAAFTNGSGAYGPMISEHMMGCILTMYRQLPHYARLQKQHIWDDNWREETLEGKTVLILGAGDIGGHLAKRLQGFDCERIIGVRRTAGPLPYFDEVYTMDAIDDLLPQADVVACALPGTRHTRGILDERRLRLMKPNALLVNCGRGNLIVTDDLIRVLQDGHLAGCALDVVDPEPLPADSPLWDMENVILTPHVSGLSFGHLDATEDKTYLIAAENLRRWLEGEPLLNQVDFEAGYRKR